MKKIQNYLLDRTLQVSYGKTVRLPVRAGVLQGIIFGPILCNIFASDPPDLPQRFQKLLFADDTLISVKGRSLRVITSRLEKSLNISALTLRI